MPSIEESVALDPTASAVVVAGPGTGKTRRLGERVQHLVEVRGLTSGDILLLTLTRETVRSLQRLIAAPAASTFHAFALKELNRIGDAAKKRIADTWEERYLVMVDMKTLAERSGLKIRITSIPRFLRRLGAGFRTTQEQEPELTDEERVLRTSWYRVRDFMSLRLMDELAYDLMGHLNNGWRLPSPPAAILVDEYQDLTPVELTVLRLLSLHHAAGLFVRGDDRQSIYGFRDADEFGLNNFGAIYGVDPTYLATSYRCPTLVLGLAEEVARRMPAVPGLTARPPLTSHESCGPGEVRVATFKSLLAEALWVVQRIRELHQPTDNAATDRRAAVIVPRDVEVYVDQLNQASDRLGAGLAFHDARDHETFTDQPPFRVAYATLRIAEDETDGLAWRTVLAFCDGVGPATIVALYNTGAGQLTAALRASAPTNAKLKGLRDFILIAQQQLRTADTREAAWTVLRGVVTSLLPGSEIESWRGRIDDVTLENEPNGAAAQLLARFRDRTHGTVADAASAQHDVLVYTIFGSKGQQWPHVFVVGAYSQGFQDSVAADGLRKLYVTLTRAMATLTITLPRFVRHTPLENAGRPTRRPSQLTFVEALAARAIPIEVDPT